MIKSPLRFVIPVVRRLSLIALLLVTPTLFAATIIWSGASGTDTNWSNGNNWIGNAAPGSGDDVKFYLTGTNGTAGVPNNLVDLSFAGTIASLQYANSNGFHTTTIADGQTLNVTGAGGLTVGTLTLVPATTLEVTATIAGLGTLNVNNTAAAILVNQCTNAGNVITPATLNMGSLGTFRATVSRVAVGTTTLGANNAQKTTGILKLAMTNVITATFTGSSISSTPAVTTNSVDVGSNNGNTGGVDYLFLGQSNAFFIDSIGVGMCKATASMLFNTNLSSPTAYFRGTGGAGSRIRFWTVGDMSSSGNSSANCNGTNDFTGGTVDILVDTMSLGRDRSGGNTGAGANKGTLTFTAGTIDVNSLYVGNQQFTATANSNPEVGVVNVLGPTAILVVNNNLVLARTNVISTAAANSSGTLSVYNGTVRASSITRGANASTIGLTNALLIITNFVGTPSLPITTFGITNSTLNLFVAATPVTNICTTTLTTDGAGNTINVQAVPVFGAGSYPRQIPLITYSTLAGAGYNFTLGSVPASAPGAFLSNNVANKSVDLYLPTDPRPIVTSAPSSYSGAPGDNVSFPATATGATTLIYQWFVGSTQLSDGATGNGSTISGSTTATLNITSAQPGDNGYYTVVITNDFGSATSAPPALLTIGTGDIPPSITGPNNQTAIQGNNATFTASVTGSPVPALQWRRAGVDLPDQTNLTLVVTNVQYATDDGVVFSIVATNVAGIKTNNATLSVIVSPAITTQPASAVVTNTQSASFTVAATGVPNPTYQWFKNASPVSSAANNSATNATFTIASTAPTDIANYYVQISNAAGSTNSATVTLTVNSVMSVTTLSPANSATGVCYDTPLYITFSQVPTLRTAGRILIFNITNSTTPVDTNDLSLCVTLNATYAKNVQPRSIGGDTFTNFPVIITGNTAAIYPHLGVLTSNQTYYVTMDDGTFVDAAGAYFAGISATNAWQFTTKVGGSANPTNLVVNADGSGDFVTVQGAVDSVPSANTTPTIINIRNGNYVELVNIKSKNNLTLRGQSRSGTVIGYANNANLQPSTHSRMAMKINANDIALDNLTLTNRTPAGGSQAEALTLESNAKRFIFNNCNLGSYQDTLLAIGGGQSQAYFNNSLITGQYDYIWGGGVVYFTNCEMRTMLGTGSQWNLTASRTDTTASAPGVDGPPWAGYNSLNSLNGFSFVNCRLTRESGSVSKISLAGSNGTTNGVASWINCILTLAYTNAVSLAVTNSQLLWEYNNTNLVLDPVPLGVTVLNTSDARYLAASSATNWLYGWEPQLTPNILTNPVSQTVTAGSPATFTVLATGIPDPTYQWLHAGTNLPTATSAALTIGSATLNDGGSYAVIVTTPAGNATSTTVTLTVNPPPNTAPVFTAPLAGTNIAINVGVNLSVTCTATDSDTPAQTLTYALLTSLSGATFDTNSGVLTWRPTVAQANSSNPVSVSATDNGTPNLSVTNNFTISVNALTQPSVDASAYVAGQFSATFSGQIGPDYALQATTNLDGGTWTTVATTNSPASMPVILTDPNASSEPVQFYRTVTGPPLP